MMLEYLLLLGGLLRSVFCSRAGQAAENLLLRQQLTVLTRPTQRRPRLRSRDKLFWVVSRTLRRDWRQHLVLGRPDTVVRWQRHPWNVSWRWRSRHQLGRPPLSADVRELIAQMARENPRWGQRADPG